MFSFFKKKGKEVTMTHLLDEIDTMVHLLQLKGTLLPHRYEDSHATEYRCKVLTSGEACHVHIRSMDEDGNLSRGRYIAIRIDLNMLSVSGDWVNNRGTLFRSSLKGNLDALIAKQMKILRDMFVGVDILPRRHSGQLIGKELIMVKENRRGRRN